MSADKSILDNPEFKKKVRDFVAQRDAQRDAHARQVFDAETANAELMTPAEFATKLKTSA